eukprot:Seg1562.1 transcript_id=Seg1562.1/GoldUCD/mRNA.D3Y31 product="Ankyrin repeat domain-containing protein 50" protein_id=Seg1562.1/GoldUCD/D3Y31
MAMTDALCSAAADGDIELVKGFISRGADLNRKSSDGFMPLCLAAFWGHSDIVKLLLEKGADVNGRNSSTRWTACHCAAFQGHGKVIMRLLEFKPKLDLKDELDRTAVDFASALDSIWPHLAAQGCKRTTKPALIRMKIVEKAPEASRHDPVGTSYEKAYFSRPGSAYVMKTQGLHPRRSSTKVTTDAGPELTDKQYAALNHGDVLTEAPNEGLLATESQSAPRFSVWRT